MRKHFALKFLVILTIFATTSCNKGKKGGSRATGWKINSKEGGFQYNTKYQEQETAPGVVFIEGGTFTKGQVNDDPMHDWTIHQINSMFNHSTWMKQKLRTLCTWNT